MIFKLVLLQARTIYNLIDEILQTRSLSAIILIGLAIIFLAIVDRNKKKQKNKVKQQGKKEGFSNQVNKSEIILSIEELLKLCRKLIQEGNTKKSLQDLLFNLEVKTESNDKFQQYYEEVLMLSNRLRRLEYNHRNNLTHSEELSIQRNNINRAILDILDEISKMERQHG